MKKHILLIALLLIVSLSAKAQFSVTYRAGYGQYEMSDMKNMLEQMRLNMMLQVSNIPFEIVDNFPGHLTHTLDVAYRFKRHEIGIQGTYNTTGGKLAYSDYTGKYWGKFTSNGYRLGLSYRIYHPVSEFNNLGSLSLFAEFSPAVTFSNLKSEEYLKIFNEEQSADENIDIDAKGISLLPQLGLKWDITPNIGISFSGGYDFQLGSHFSYQGKKSSLKSDWSGLRINGGISFSFGK